MKRITDPTFRYVNAAETDIRKTFKRIREQQKQAEQEREAKVRSLPTRKVGAR